MTDYTQACSGTSGVLIMQCYVQVVIVKKLVYTPTKSQLKAYYDNIMKQTVPESYVVSIHTLQSDYNNSGKGVRIGLFL